MNRRIFFFAALAAFSLPCAEPQIPDTPAGHQFTAWLAAFNDPDSDAYERYAAKFDPNRPPGAEQRSRQFRQQTGGFKLIKVEEAADFHFSAFHQERGSPQCARSVRDVEEGEAHEIAN